MSAHEGLRHKCLEPFISHPQFFKSYGTDSRSGNRTNVAPILNDCTIKILIKMSQKFMCHVTSLTVLYFFAMTHTHIVHFHVICITPIPQNKFVLHFYKHNNVTTQSIDTLHACVYYCTKFGISEWDLDQSVGGKQVVSADSSKKMAFVSVRLQNHS